MRQRKDQSVRAAPLAVQVKVTEEPGKVESLVGERRLGSPLPLLLVVLLELVLLLLEVVLLLPEPAPVVYWTSVLLQVPLVYRHCRRTQTGVPLVGRPEAVPARVPLDRLPLL